ncbi:type 2 periplasmic-binding domain-containing protein [Francisella persica]|nr:hypothetical protein [Francisella persica]
MPKIVPKFKKDYHNFEISAVENDTDKLIYMLYKDQLGFAFLAESIEDSNLNIERVF